MKRTNLLRGAAVCLIAALALSSCDQISSITKKVTGSDKKPKTEVSKPGDKDAVKGGKDAPAATVFAVNTTRSVKGQIKDYLLLSGDIISSSTVDAYSDVAGKVVKLHVSIGDRIVKDAPIADIDPSRPGMNFVAGVAKAPISGIIVALPAQLGMTISQAVPVARISRTDSLELRTYVAERFVSKIRVGFRAEVSLDAYPGREFLASVRELSPVLDPASRTMEVRLDLIRPDLSLKSGMFAKVKIITEEKNGVVKIPSSTVVKRFGENYVFTVEADPKDPALLVARRRPVVPGILIDDKLEILKGLAPNEEIVARGQTLLEDGSRVNVVDRVPPLAAAE
ncbi:MAG: efflux RND transporter periplasmic adaptor subunit [Treponemataceae bacterium]